MGMIPTRYLGPVHALGLCWREEGMKGLFRGYTAYILATSIYLVIVPLVAELKIQRSAFYGTQRDDNDDLY
jgi:hypothetical protein